jgi:starch-binding outer membrane protein SusE/F
MKKVKIFQSLALFVTAIVIIASCTKEVADVRLSSKLGTTTALNVTSDSATITAFVVAVGDGFVQKGVCYSTTANATPYNTKVIFAGTDSKATYSIRIGGLAFATKYYARGYAINEHGTFLGDEVSFTTLPVKATLTTTAVTVITGNSAKSGGNITVAGGSTVTARGVCWATTHNPTVAGSKTVDGSGTGTFTSNLTGLAGNTLYYVRAYATSAAGTAYGTEVSFTTLVDFPVVTTTAVTSITKTTAVSGGNVTYDGGGTITAKGLAWGTSANPTITGSVIDGGTGLGVFVSNLDPLAKNTTYHVRAYATNSAGTAYGSDLSFTTLADINKFFVVGSYNGWDNSDNALYIISTATNPEAEGYVDFPASGEFKLTTDHSWDAAHTFGDDGAGNLTNPGNNITAPTAGYYFIKANPSAVPMTYSRVATAWGLIGDATPGGWGGETALTYNTSLKVWTGGMTLTAAEAKFRANNDWGYNYGSNAHDGNLQPGGNNIPIAVAGVYAITLDLSHPNAYTYSFNRWGLIGAATPGGWSTDTFMTWDGTNKVFTVTLDLTADEYKFRANADWGVNLGGSLGALTQGGGNLSVSTAGNYTITLDPWTLVATVTKN